MCPEKKGEMQERFKIKSKTHFIHDDQTKRKIRIRRNEFG